MEKVLIVLTSHGELGRTRRKTGYFLAEVAHPYKVFADAGYAVDFVSPKGGEPPMEGADLGDPVQKDFLENQEIRIKLRNTLRPNQIDPRAYEAVFFAGGHGTMWDFPGNEGLKSIARTIYENEGVVSAVCHGPAAFVDLKLTNGRYLVESKTVSCFTDDEETQVELSDIVPFLLETRLAERGAKIVKAPPMQEMVAVSGRLVTGQNPVSSAGVAAKVVEELSRRPVRV